MSLVFVGFSSAQAGSYEDFFTAIRRDDPRGVMRLIFRDFDPNTLDPQGQHGLLLAMRLESYKAADVLTIAPKIDANWLNANGESALMLAVLKGQGKLAEQLIARGADVNKTGWTPLHYAATGGQAAMVRLLLDHHAFVDAESPNGTTPLMMAAQYGSPEALRLLLEEGAQPGQKNQGGLTALDFARRGGRPDAIAILGALAKAEAKPAAVVPAPVPEPSQPAAAMAESAMPAVNAPVAEPAKPAANKLPEPERQTVPVSPSSSAAPVKPLSPATSPATSGSPSPSSDPKPKATW